MQQTSHTPSLCSDSTSTPPSHCKPPIVRLIHYGYRRCLYNTSPNKASNPLPRSGNSGKRCNTKTLVRRCVSTLCLPWLTVRGAANAVARIDNLEFLSDVVPQTVAVKQTRETKSAKSKKKAATVEMGQRKLSALMKPKDAAVARVEATPEPESDDGASSQKEMGKDTGVGRSDDEDVVMG